MKTWNLIQTDAERYFQRKTSKSSIVKHFFKSPPIRAVILIRIALSTQGFLSWFCRTLLFSYHSIDLCRSTKIDCGLVLPHPFGITFGCGSVVMSNCTIYQNVTLGAKNDKYPSIRNNVTIYPGTVIVGNIEIGENAVIGALSFVDKSVEKSDIFHSRS